MDRLRVVTWNVMSGGFADYNYSLLAPERLPLIKHGLNELDGDVVILIDTFRWDELYTQEKMAQLFDYTQAVCINLDDERLQKLGHNNGITVLSRLPCIRQQPVWIETRNALYTRLQWSSDVIDVFGVYLDDKNEDLRRKQLGTLGNHLNAHRATMVAGDLNTIDPEVIRETKTRIDAFLKAHPESPGYIIEYLKELRQANVLGQMDAYGLVSANEGHETTMPTPLFPVKVKQGVFELDYIYYSEAFLQLRSFDVIKNALFRKASDHYPLVAEVEKK